MKIRKMHHVAYRCKDAKETVNWYVKHLNMDFVLAIAEDHVPSTHAPDPYMHLFLDAGGGNVLAFFELPNSPAMGRDTNTPEWVQHIAFEVVDLATLSLARARLLERDIEVVGPTDHGLFCSIYFFDPNGHRLELTCNTASAAETAKARANAEPMLAEWSRTKQAPKHKAWLHSSAEHET